MKTYGRGRRSCFITDERTLGGRRRCFDKQTHLTMNKTKIKQTRITKTRWRPEIRLPLRTDRKRLIKINVDVFIPRGDFDVDVTLKVVIRSGEVHDRRGYPAGQTTGLINVRLNGTEVWNTEHRKTKANQHVKRNDQFCRQWT